MANKDENFDVEEWAEEGIKDAEGKVDDDFEEAPAEEEQEEQEEPAKADEEPAKKSPEEEEEQQAESTINKLLSPEEQQRVPVEDHIKLRQRAQAAEKRAEEAESQLAEQATQTEGAKSGKTDKLAELEDDDLVRAGDVRQAIKQEVDKVSKGIESERATQEAQAMAANAVKSEESFRKDTADYDQVTSAANELGVISDADRKVIFKDPNPAKKYYEIAKERVSNIQKHLGITTTTTPKSPKPKKETGEEEEEEETLTDDQIFDEVYG